MCKYSSGRAIDATVTSSYITSVITIVSNVIAIILYRVRVAVYAQLSVRYTPPRIAVPRIVGTDFLLYRVGVQ